MCNIIIGSIVTVLSVLIGGIITYYIGQREIKRNKKIEIYLEFLHIAHGRYFTESSELTEEYMNVLRKVYLIASPEVLIALKTSGYMPIKGQRWSDKDPIENPFELIIKAMRKDISNNQRKIKEFEFTNFFFKASS